MIRPVHIPQILNASNKTLLIDVAQHLAQLETLTPLKGELSVTHQGTYLEVKGKADAIMTLACDRCLQNYNTRIQVDASEMVWLEDARTDESDPEKEVDLEDLIESLPPSGDFDPAEWLYQQMCLAIPQKKICSAECGGIPFENPESVDKVVDHRWAALSALKQKLAE